MFLFKKDFLHNLHYYTHLRLKSEVKNSKSMYYWTYIEPLFLALLFYLVFSVFYKSSNSFVIFILSGKFFYLIFIKLFINFSNIFISYKEILKKNDLSKYHLIIFETYFQLNKFFIFIILFTLYVIYLIISHNLSFVILFYYLFLVLTLIINALAFGLILSIIRVIFTPSVVLIEIMPLILLFASGIFFEIETINSNLIKQFLYINPLAFFIKDLRAVIFDFNMNNAVVLLIIVFLSFVSIELSTKYVSFSKNFNKKLFLNN